jgi:hypothetical protein
MSKKKIIIATKQKLGGICVSPVMLAGQRRD